MSVTSKYVVILWALVFAPLANSAYAAVSDPAAIQVQTFILHSSTPCRRVRLSHGR